MPYFVSFDARWRELLRLNPIRIVLIDDTTRGINIGRAQDVEFHLMLEEAMSPEARLARSPEQIEARRMSARTLSRSAMEALASKEAAAWT